MGKTRYPGIYTRTTQKGLVYDAMASHGGKKRQSRGYRTMAEARAWQASEVAQMRSGQYGGASVRMTLGEFLMEQWWPYTKELLKSSESVRAYESQLRHVVGWCRCSLRRKDRHAFEEREKCKTWVSRLGEAKLRAVQPLDIEAFKTHMKREGVGAAMQNAAFDRLRQALNEAVRWELIGRNPCDKVRAPSEPEHAAPVLTNDEVRKLLDAADRTPFGVLFYLTVMTGMRWSEITKLRWSDIDFGTGRLNIPRINTKTKAGARPVWLGPGSLARLQAHRAEQMRYFSDLFGPDAPQPQLVFTNTIGGGLTQANFANRYWYPLREALALPSMHFHDLRHVQATLLARAKVHPAVMQARLGHADARTTLEIYTNINPEDQSDAALAVEVLLEVNEG